MISLLIALMMGLFPGTTAASALKAEVDALAGRSSVGPSSAERFSVERFSVGRSSVGRSSAERSPVERFSVGPSSVERSPVERFSVGPSSVGPISAGPISIGRSSVGPFSVGPSSVERSSAGPSSAGRSSIRRSSVERSSAGPISIRRSSVGPPSVGRSPAGRSSSVGPIFAAFQTPSGGVKAVASEGSGSSSSGEEGSGSDEEQSGADLALVEGPGAEGAAEEVEDGEAGGEKPGAEEAGGEKAGDAVPEGWLPELRTADSFRVQRRLYPKSRRLFVDLGAEVLSRGDFYINPGVALSLAWFFDENWALELGASRYFPFLNPAASQVRESTGFVPNSRAPAWMFRGGARLSLGYGKIMLQGSVLHLEPQLFARLPVLLAEGSPGFGVELGGGALLHLAPQLHLRLDLAVFPHAERRDGWTFVLAVVPWLSMGMAFP